MMACKCNTSYLGLSWIPCTANALMSVAHQEMHCLTAAQDCRVSLSRDKVMQKATELCDLLQLEFIFVPVSNLEMIGIDFWYMRQAMAKSSPLGIDKTFLKSLVFYFIYI